MAWIYLLLAGVFEIGWPLGFKLSQQAEYRISGIVGAIISMAFSGVLLWMAQREIPIGTAYAVWTGIGGAGTFLIGVMFFGDPASLVRFVGVALIVGGAALYFFKFKKPKADTKGGDELDEYDFGEDEDDEDEPTPEDEEPAQDKEE